MLLTLIVLKTTGYHKGNIAPVHAMKAYMGSRDKTPSVPKLRTRWRCVVRFLLWPLYRWEKNTLYLLNRRLGGAQSQSAYSGKKY